MTLTPVGILARLWDQSCPVVELGTACLRESPVDRFSIVPLLGGALVGALGGGTLAFGAFSVAAAAVERSIVIEDSGGPAPACPTQPSTANALCDVAFGAFGWWLGHELYRSRRRELGRARRRARGL